MIMVILTRKHHRVISLFSCFYTNLPFSQKNLLLLIWINNLLWTTSSFQNKSPHHHLVRESIAASSLTYINIHFGRGDPESRPSIPSLADLNCTDDCEVSENVYLRSFWYLLCNVYVTRMRRVPMLIYGRYIQCLYIYARCTYIHVHTHTHTIDR